MRLDINGVLQAHFMRALSQRVCGDGFDVVKRPASFVLKKEIEGERTVKRLILLPPKGYTADTLYLMNSHDEAERATITINGGVRAGKNGFSKIKNCLLMASFNKSSMSDKLDKPYRTFDPEKLNDPDLQTNVYSAGGPPFSAVKANGEGFYHNLINLSNDWLVLTLDKKLRPQRGVDLEPMLHQLPQEQAAVLRSFYGEVLKHGDGVFKEAKELINQVIDMPPDSSLPALGEMLHVHDSGRHEACSVFAVILKIGKNHPVQVLSFLDEAIKNNSVPSFYAEQLIRKVDNFKDYGSIGQSGYQP